MPRSPSYGSTARPPSAHAVRADFSGLLASLSPSQTPFFGLGIEVGPTFDVLSLRVAWKVRRLKLEIAVSGHAFVLKVVDFFLIFLNFFHYRSEEHTSELQSLRHLVC